MKILCKRMKVLNDEKIPDRLFFRAGGTCGKSRRAVRGVREGCERLERGGTLGGANERDGGGVGRDGNGADHFAGRSRVGGDMTVRIVDAPTWPLEVESA